MNQLSQPQNETQTGLNIRRAAHRAGGCTRRASVLRPISSSYPAQFQAAQTDPKGFFLAGGRGPVNGL